MSRDAITELLIEVEHDRSAVDRVLPLIYEEMRGLAENHLRGERVDHTLSPTALVHEAYLKLVDQTRVQWQNRGHFLAVASMAMRRILVNHARDRARLKRGGQVERIAFTESILPGDENASLLELDDLLDRLEAFDERATRVVECRFFGGLSIDETAEALQLSPMTVKRSWRLAKTWLRREMES